MHRYFRALDGARALAIGIVLAAHGGVTWFRSGGVGVDLFFVLSGFLITSILAAEAEATGDLSFRNFYIRRFLRLVPCLVLTCAFVALWHLGTTGTVPSTGIAVALTYTANWVRAFSDTDLSWLIHCWTLAIEEQFYLIWPVVVLALDRTVRDTRTKGFILVVGALLIAVYRAGIVGIYTDERINYGLDTRMDSLMAGAALAYFLRSLPAGGLSDLASRLLGRLLAPGALLVLLSIPQIVTWYSPWMGRFGYVIVAIASATLIADLVAGRHSLLAGPFAWTPAVYIGRISYGIYLLHLPVFFIVEGHLAELPSLAKLGLKLALTLAAASLSFHVLEQPFLRLKSRFETQGAAAPRRALA
jgi:peptidoglycan/LPS O-acetylase OafA/YrhL